MEGSGSPLRVAFVGSWVPRRCGIATFSSDLAAAVMGRAAVSIGVIAIDEPTAGDRSYDDAVIGRIAQHDRASYRGAGSIAATWGADVVSIQHEFGLYGTDDGRTYTDHLVALLDSLRVPAITTLHTVLPKPAPWMREVVRDIAGRSAAVVVMTATAERLLRDDYGILERITIIPHGVPTVAPSAEGREIAKRRLGFAGRRLVSTFGLVDPRKGIEYAIAGFAEAARTREDVVYLIAGQTHPELIRKEGEAYRRRLVALAEGSGVADRVVFMNDYLSLERIVDLLVATDVYVTPYLDPNQITSGTLSYALGAGRAVISTPYLHAAEVLANERGVLVDFRSSAQIGAALAGVLDSPDYKKRLEQRAWAYGRQTGWPAVGERFRVLMNEVAVRTRLRVPARPVIPALATSRPAA